MHSFAIADNAYLGLIRDQNVHKVSADLTSVRIAVVVTMYFWHTLISRQGYMCDTSNDEGVYAMRVYSAMNIGKVNAICSLKGSGGKNSHMGLPCA